MRFRPLQVRGAQKVVCKISVSTAMEQRRLLECQYRMRGRSVAELPSAGRDWEWNLRFKKDQRKSELKHSLSSGLCGLHESPLLVDVLMFSQSRILKLT